MRRDQSFQFSPVTRLVRPGDGQLPTRWIDPGPGFDQFRISLYRVQPPDGQRPARTGILRQRRAAGWTAHGFFTAIWNRFQPAAGKQYCQITAFLLAARHQARRAHQVVPLVQPPGDVLFPGLVPQRPAGQHAPGGNDVRQFSPPRQPRGRVQQRAPQSVQVHQAVVRAPVPGAGKVPPEPPNMKAGRRQRRVIDAIRGQIHHRIAAVLVQHAHLHIPAPRLASRQRRHRTRRPAAGDIEVAHHVDDPQIHSEP